MKKDNAKLAELWRQFPVSSAGKPRTRSYMMRCRNSCSTKRSVAKHGAIALPAAAAMCSKKMCMLTEYG